MKNLEIYNAILENKTPVIDLADIMLFNDWIVNKPDLIPAIVNNFFIVKLKNHLGLNRIIDNDGNTEALVIDTSETFYSLPEKCEFGSIKSSYYPVKNSDLLVNTVIGCPVVKRSEVDNLVGEVGLMNYLNNYHNSLITPATETTKEQFLEMLEVLPPCRWDRSAGVEYFHVSERLSGDLVSWYAKYNHKYFEFVDSSTIPVSQIIKKVKG